MSANGTCGNCTWELDDKGKLMIAPVSGTDGMLEHEVDRNWPWLAEKWPWYSHREDIVSCVVMPGVVAMNCNEMFRDCDGLKSLDLSGLDTSNVKDMHWMFGGCHDLTSVDLSVFDTSAVEDMSGMFHDCSSIESIDLSGLDTSEVESMHAMFYGCSSLTTLDLSDVDTSKVEDMGSMFRDCHSLASLDLTGFDTSKVENMCRMFDGCSSLTSIDISEFDMSSADNTRFMFVGCHNLTSLDLPGNLLKLTKLQIDACFGDMVAAGELKNDCVISYKGSPAVEVVAHDHTFCVDESNRSVRAASLVSDMVTGGVEVGELSDSVEY